jgi:hypothetical protein
MAVPSQIARLRTRCGTRCWTRSSRRAPYRTPQVGVQKASRFLLVTGHQVPIQIEGDRHARVTHVRAQRLRVDARGDHERREGVPALVQRDRTQSRALPGPLRTTITVTGANASSGPRPNTRPVPPVARASSRSCTSRTDAIGTARVPAFVFGPTRKPLLIDTRSRYQDRGAAPAAPTRKVPTNPIARVNEPRSSDQVGRAASSNGR